MKWPVATGTSYELSSSVSGGSGAPPEPPAPVVPAVPPPFNPPAPEPKPVPAFPVGGVDDPPGESLLAPAQAGSTSSSAQATKRFVTGETFEQPTCHCVERAGAARVSPTCDRARHHRGARSATFVSRRLQAYTRGGSGATSRTGPAAVRAAKRAVPGGSDAIARSSGRRSSSASSSIAT